MKNTFSILAIYGKVILLLLCLLSSAIMTAQVREVRNAPSPEVANLGSFGSIPVGHYTGTPDISVPLYTMKVGKFSLPIQAMYHLSNVKPHTPPSSLGIGWVLSAGGYIARNVKGVQDEKVSSTTNAGYYFNHNKIIAIDNSSDKSQELRDNTHMSGNDWYELSADEFSFSFNGYCGTFFMDKDGQWRVISDDNIKVEFNPTTGFKTITDLRKRLNFNYNAVGYNKKFFDRFTLITPDGTRYEFGGDYATEYCVPYYNQVNGDIMATCWRLSKITTIDQRVVNFEYAADSYMCDIHYAPQIIYYYNENHSNENTIIRNIGYAGFSGFLMMPSRLIKISSDDESISFNYSRDNNYGESLYNNNSNCLYWKDAAARYVYKNDISQNLSEYRFTQFLGIDITDSRPHQEIRNEIAEKITQDYLSDIIVKKSGFNTLQIGFDYFDNKSRKLLSCIQFKSEKLPENIGGYDNGPENMNNLKANKAKGGGNPIIETPEDYSNTEKEYKYTFDYYSKSGDNWSKRNALIYTDSWGYFSKHGENPNNLGEWLLTNGNSYTQNSFTIRQADSSNTKVFALRSIIYPTGGKTVFYYELNDYSQEFDIQSNTVTKLSNNKTAGGLRLKAQKCYDESEVLQYTKYYTYKTAIGGPSSGISKGTPCYHDRIFFTEDKKKYIDFYSFDEICPYPLNFNTPSVGYSTVFEDIKDSQGQLLSRTKYQFTNYDMDTNNKWHKDLPADDSAYVYGNYASAAFTSMAFERGKPTSKEVLDAQNNILEKTTFDYVRTEGEPFSTISQEWHMDKSDLFAFSYLYKTYANRYLVSVEKKQEYLDNGVYRYDTQYQYTNYGLLKQKSVVTNSGEKYYTSYLYNIDSLFLDTVSDVNTYTMMQKKNIIVPVRIEERKGDLTDIRTSTQYIYSLSSMGVPYISQENLLWESNEIVWKYPSYTIEKADLYGNPVVWKENGVLTIMIWSHKGQRLMASIQKATYEEVASALGNIPEYYSGLSMPTISLDNLRAKLPGALVYTYQYDNKLNLISKTDPNGLIRMYDYDSLGRLIAEYRHVGGKTELLNKYKYSYKFK